MENHRSISPIADDQRRGHLVDRASPLFGVVWVNPDRKWGTPCFFGTRVPVRALFDYLRAGPPIEEFLDDFPGVTADHVEAVVTLAPARFIPKGNAA